MKKLYATPDPSEGGLMNSALKARGFATLVRNEYLAGAIGELPPQECWYEIWVAEGDYTAAGRVLAELKGPAVDGAPWTCGRCGERLEPQFAACWKCGEPRGGEAQAG